jgi:methylglutaconyl-CoA hydratase
MTTAPQPQSQSLIFEIEDRIARVRLNRPEVHNAFNPALIGELHATFEYIASLQRGDVRAVVLSGEGKSFCAGADVNWMRESLQYSREENVADSLRMAHMFDQINRCPVPVIGRIHGAALGGGVGLAAVCDIVVAAEGTTWGLSEVKLGIAPAVISPYVLAKIGRSHARSLFLTGERFSTEGALRIGLAHYMVPVDQLDAEIERLVGEIGSAGPTGVERAKWLISVVPDLEPGEATQLTAETIAALRTGPEGQEGLKAFLEKRKPEWAG